MFKKWLRVSIIFSMLATLGLGVGGLGCGGEENDLNGEFIDEFGEGFGGPLDEFDEGGPDALDGDVGEPLD